MNTSKSVAERLPYVRLGTLPRRIKRRRTDGSPYLMILPAVIAELAVHILPMILGIWIAFISLTQTNLSNWLAAPFVGVRNFVTAFDPSQPLGQDLYASLGRTLLYVALVLAFSWALGMAAAIFLSSNMKARGFFRTLFLTPYVIPTFVGTMAWGFMFNNRDGLINGIIVDTLHLTSERPFWLIGDNSFIVLVITSVWHMWPFAFLMLLAALQGVPSDIYEAASLDGASQWRQFRSMTIPLIQPANGVLLLVMGLWLFNMFTIPFVLFGSTPPAASTLLSPLIYQRSFVDWNFGLGAAMSVLLLVLLFIFSLVYMRLVLPKEEQR